MPGAPLATAYIALVPTTQGLQRGIQRDLNRVGGQAGTSAGAEFGSNFASNASGGIGRVKSLLAGVAKGAGLVTAASVAAGGALTALGIKGAASLETTTTSFAALLGSTKAATAQIKVLQQYAAKTPFSQEDVLGYAQQYYALAGSIGLSQKQLIPFLDAVGNLGAVTGASTENIRNAVTAIGQIGSSGKVTLDNLNQISEAFPGFNGAAAIASATGQTTADVMKQISAGTLDAKTGVNALLVGMQNFKGAAGAMTKQSETLNGLFSTFTDTIKIKLTQAFQGLIPVAKQTLTQITPVIASTLTTLAPTIATVVKGLQPLIVPLIQGLGTALGAVFKQLGPIFTTLAPLIKPLVDSFVTLVNAVGPIVQLFAQLAAQLGPPLLAIFNELVSALGPVVAALSQALAPVLPVIAQVLTQVGVALQPVVKALAGAFTTALRAIGPLLPTLARAFGQIAVALAQMLTPFIPVVTALVDAFAPVLPIIATALKDVAIALQPVVKAFAGALVQVITDLKPQLPAIATAFADMAVAIAKLLVSLTPLIKPLTSLVSLLLKIGGNVLVAIAEAITKIANALADLAGIISNTVDNLGGFVSNVNGASGKVIGSVNGMSDAFDRADAAAKLSATLNASQVVDATNALIGGFIPGFNAMQNAAHLVATIDVSQVVAGLTSIAGLIIPGAGILGALAGLGQRLASTPISSSGPVVGTAGVPGFTVPSGGGTPTTPTTGTASKPPKPPAFDKSTLTDFIKSLKQPAAQVKQAYDAIVASALASKRLSPAAAKAFRSVEHDFLLIVKQRDAVNAKLAKARDVLAKRKARLNEEKSTVKSAVTGTFSIASAGTGFDGQQPVTFNRILAQLKQAVARASRFTAILKKLAREGLAKGLLQQLAEAGPGALPQAEALLAATPKQIKTLNQQYRKLDSVGSTLGGFIAKDLYGAGVTAAQGLVNGLKSQQSVLNTAIRQIGQSMIDTMKTVLKIKSPSRVMFDVGTNTGKGFALGIGSQHQAVKSQAARLANAATPMSQLAAWADQEGMAVTVVSVIDGKEVARSQAKVGLSSSPTARAGGFTS
jgi:tape measure domain-containing protein